MSIVTSNGEIIAQNGITHSNETKTKKKASLRKTLTFGKLDVKKVRATGLKRF